MDATSLKYGSFILLPYPFIVNGDRGLDKMSSNFLSFMEMNKNFESWECVDAFSL